MHRERNAAYLRSARCYCEEVSRRIRKRAPSTFSASFQNRNLKRNSSGNSRWRLASNRYQIFRQVDFPVPIRPTSSKPVSGSFPVCRQLFKNDFRRRWEPERHSILGCYLFGIMGRILSSASCQRRYIPHDPLRNVTRLCDSRHCATVRSSTSL